MGVLNPLKKLNGITTQAPSGIYKADKKLSNRKWLQSNKWSGRLNLTGCGNSLITNNNNCFRPDSITFIISPVFYHKTKIAAIIISAAAGNSCITRVIDTIRIRYQNICF